MGILFALLSMTLWGVEELFIKEAVPRLKSFTTLFINTASGFVIVLIGVFVFFWDEITIISGSDFLMVLATTVLGFMGWLYFYKALERQKLSLIASLDESWIVIAVLIGIFFLGESVDVLHGIAIVAILVGAFFVSANFSHLRHINFIAGSGYETASIVTIGLTVPLEKIVVTSIGEANTILYIYILTLFFILLWGIVSGWKRVVRPTNALFKTAAASGLFDSLSFFFFLFALQETDVAIVSPIVASSVVVALILARIYLKEKITPKEIFGAVLIFAGVITLSMTGSA